MFGCDGILWGVGFDQSVIKVKKSENEEGATFTRLVPRPGDLKEGVCLVWRVKISNLQFRKPIAIVSLSKW